MVQKKVAKANNKLGIQANTCKTEKKQTVIKSSLQNHDCKSKVADLKAIKMKKSRSNKRSNLDIPLVTPAQTPSPKKPLTCKSPYTSPNYMKSTTSSEARKEKASKISNNLSTSKLHRVAKTLNKTSTLEKMRTLTKAPSFKHTRTSGACKKAVLCQSNLDVQKATCSSTLKDSKYPTYLKLKDGATEAEGNSVFKVCPYNYCSLNGHYHMSAPPLKRFLSSRRKMLKSVKFRPDVLSPPSEVTTLECKKANGENDQNNDLFIEVYVPDRKISTQISECLSDGPCSEIEFQDNVDQVEVTYLSGIKSSSLADGGYLQVPIEKQTSFESLTLSLDGYFGENSDMEWEEGQSNVMYDKCEIFVQTDYSKDQDEPEFELNNSDGGGYMECLAEDNPPYFHDEIVECLCFSDTDSLTDSESTHTGDKHADDKKSEPIKKITEDFSLPDEATVSAAKHEYESIGKHGEIFFDIFEEMTEPQNEELVSNQDIDETNNGDELNEKSFTAEEIREKEKEAAEIVMEEREPSEAMSKHVPTITYDLETSSETETNHNVSGIEADNLFHRRSTNSDHKEGESNKVSFYLNENNDANVKTSRMKDCHKIEEADASPTIRKNKQEAVAGVSNKMRRLRCRKMDEETEEEREFNPRKPNFLAAEPEPESEKVDLRHQEMDERRNAEEWMLDHALQKTVNQLAPARKRKVALLVEAFESVLPLPVPKCELKNRRRTQPGFTHLRTVQACS